MRVFDKDPGIFYQSKLCQDWLKNLDPDFDIDTVEVQVVDFRGEPKVENVLFVRLRVKLQGDDKWHVVELRGDTAAIFPVISCGGKIFTILVHQLRLATGRKDLAEIPAGMIDGGTFRGAAARELEEELGLVFAEDDLIDLCAELPGTSDAIYSSPGLLDEKIAYYLAPKEMTSEQLAELQGKATGLQEEGERITLEVIPLSDLSYKTRDGKAFVAFALYLMYLEQRRRAESAWVLGLEGWNSPLFFIFQIARVLLFC